MIHLVIDLRSGQEVGPGLQPNDIMVFEAGRMSYERSFHEDG